MSKLARAIALAGATLLLLVTVGSLPAYAAGNSGAASVALGIASWPVILAGVCGAASTQLTALLTHRNAPQWFKSGVNLVLTSLAGVLITIQVIPGHTWKDYLAEIAVGELVALGMHYSGATAFAAAASANVGLGGNLTPIVAATPQSPGIIKPRTEPRKSARRKARQ